MAARSLDDVGTRYKHFGELLDDLRDAKEIMINLPKYKHGANHAEQVMQIIGSVSLIENMLLAWSEYYSEQWGLDRKVNEIPFDPTMIKGGRGTSILELYPTLERANNDKEWT